MAAAVVPLQLSAALAETAHTAVLVAAVVPKTTLQVPEPGVPRSTAVTAVQVLLTPTTPRLELLVPMAAVAVAVAAAKAEPPAKAERALSRCGEWYKRRKGLIRWTI